jgi:hypothetical protein
LRPSLARSSPAGDLRLKAWSTGADAALGSAVVSPSDPAGVNVAGVKKHRGRCDSRTRRRLGHDLPVAVLAGVVGPIRAALRAPGLAH